MRLLPTIAAALLFPLWASVAVVVAVGALVLAALVALLPFTSPIMIPVGYVLDGRRK